MKRAFYQEESYFSSFLVTKSLLLSNYSKSLIRFSPKNRHYILDNYTNIHGALLKRKALKLGFKTLSVLKQNNRAQCYRLWVPSNINIEFDTSYVLTLLGGLQYFVFHPNLFKVSKLTCILLKPKRSVFKAYCLGVVGTIPKISFLFYHFFSVRADIHLSLKFLNYKTLISSLETLKISKNNFLCVSRLAIYGIKLKLKIVRKKFKYEKKYWLRKRKYFCRFQSIFKTKPIQAESLPVPLYIKKGSKEQYRKTILGSNRKQRRRAAAKYWYVRSRKTFTKVLRKWRSKK